MDLKNRVTFVTGGCGLLGRNFAESIVHSNGKVVIADIDGPKALAIANELNQNFQEDKAYAVSLDITDKTSINNAIQIVDSNFGVVETLVNNAYPRTKNYGLPFNEIDYGDFCEMLNLNLGGYFLTSQQFAKYFKKMGRGHIVTISSIYGVIPPKFEIYNETEMTTPVEYAVIKSGLIHLNKYMEKFYKRSGIRFNCISPGGILDSQPQSFVENYNSNCNKIGMLSPFDISNALLFLISEEARAITGQNLVIDDGFTV